MAEEITSGGSKAESMEIEVEEEKVSIQEAVDEELGGEEEEPEQIEALQQVNAALVETSAKMIGKLAAMITKIPEMDFDESEVQQLKDLWTPIMPTMSPVLGAVIGTLIIVTGKAGVYYAKKGEKRSAERAAEEKSEYVPPELD